MTDVKSKKLQPEEYLRQHYEQDIRPDGRSGLTSLRPVSISSGSINTADGSAVVKQGETIVVCGIKLEIAEPKPETPNLGYIVPNLTLSPICHPQFKQGPPSETAQVASNFLFQVLNNSNYVDLEDLCILEGKFVWVLYIDLTCLNYAGNILDVSVKAMISALKNVRVPKVNVVQQPTDSDLEEPPKLEISDDEQSKRPLQLRNVPISHTVCVFEDKLLLDPVQEEEEVSNSSITIVITPENEVCHLHKPGGVAMAPDQLQKCISLAKKHSKSVYKLIETASNVQLGRNKQA